MNWHGFHWSAWVSGIALFLAMVGFGLAHCAAYDWDWRCQVGDCRIVKCSEGGAVRVERGE